MERIIQDVVLKTVALHKEYCTGEIVVHALRGVDIEIKSGEFVAIMGHSGSGKSTLLNMIGCLDNLTSGEIYINGEDVSVMNDNQLSEIRNREIGFVFQSFNLFMRLSCFHNVETPLIYQGMERKKRREMATDILEKVGLGDKIEAHPAILSGGQKQRVAIARALVTRPAIILADEPTGALDTTTSAEIMDILIQLNKQDNITIIMVTHEKDIADYAEKTIHIRDGKVEKITQNN